MSSRHYAFKLMPAHMASVIQQHNFVVVCAAVHPNVCRPFPLQKQTSVHCLAKDGQAGNHRRPPCLTTGANGAPTLTPAQDKEHLCLQLTGTVHRPATSSLYIPLASKQTRLSVEHRQHMQEGLPALHAGQPPATCAPRMGQRPG